MLNELENYECELVLVRGISGSGKSTFVKKNYPTYNHYEADMFFYDEDGNYNFDPAKIKTAHEWCQNQTRNSLKKRENTIVSNTFVRHWEMKYYLDLAKELNVPVRVYRTTKQYKNVHGVPDEAIQRMKQNFEDFENEILIK